ncbi:DMT family transporter [Sulfitobacter sp. BSw21498]|uniref:DMT family transporter n=1 Tax=Sulfitobacter sp. BSw21498 TaxID=664426 RepID=UPI0020C79A55|nr:DMT family transporter [Sulfitobacter sp. BSw21498]
MKDEAMTNTQAPLMASLIVVFTGAIWGFYWIPVRALAELGLLGAWGTLAITAAAAMLLSPVAYHKRKQLLQADPLALASIALGGAAFALYSIGFVYGRVAIIILLYFLTPVWSALIGRYVMGWPISRLRLAAILVGLAGLFIMLGAEGELPLPRGMGEWMALAAGILWSIGTTGMRAKSDLTPGPSAFIFASGAAITALILAPIFSQLPSGGGDIVKPLGWALATGGLWWGISIASLMWATVRLEPARVGLLLMSEVVVGAASAALIAAERLSPLEFVGGALVLCAGVLEIWPARRRCQDTAISGT